MELELDHIRRIQDRVAHVELSNESLKVDLIDHICCMIEDKVASGTSLEVAELEVMSEMGGVQIQAIDIETTLLTQNKITMKKRTKIIGYLALSLLIIGFIFKMMHWPAAGVLWGAGVLTSAFGFALLLFVDRFTYEQSKALKVSSVIGYLGTASVLLGFGFKLLNWPIASDMIAIGGFILMIYFILNSAFIGQPEPKN